MSRHLTAGSQVIQGRFPGGLPTIIQPETAPSQRQGAVYVRDAVHRGAPQFYRHVAQQKAREQARAAQPRRTSSASQLPERFSFAPSIGMPMPPVVHRKMEAFFGSDFSDVRIHVGPEAGLALMNRSDIADTLATYQPYHAARAELLRRAGRMGDARAAYGQALDLTVNAAERAFLERQLATTDGTGTDD